jgi:uncharacterized protein (DUF2249 family)
MHSWIEFQVNLKEIGMIGGCPHDGVDDYCARLKRTCNPVSNGCILEGKVRLLDSGNGGENMNTKIETLDLRPLPAYERHEKIFQAWNSLEPGETLKIINDHDPKPLRYQFKAEQSGKFEWDYEKEGPVDWIVNIKRT